MTFLIRPMINEKSMLLIKGDQYTFEVNKDATKDGVAKLVASKFKVDPINVKMINLPKKKKLQRTRKGVFYTGGIRKAIVRVKKGQKIGIFEVAVAEAQKQEVVVTTGEGEPIATTKEKKSLLGTTKVKIEKTANSRATEKKIEEERDSSQRPGKTKGEKPKTIKRIG